MNPRNVILRPLALLGVCLLTCSTLFASTRSGGYSLPYGNQTAGGSIDAYGTMSNSGTSRYSYGRLSGSVRLFGISREAGRIEASGTQSYGSGSGSLTVRVGGMTIWTQSLSASGGRSFSNSLNVFTPAPATTLIVAGFIPVTLTGNVGVGVSLSLQWALVVPTLSAGITGTTQAWGYGTATAAAGIPGYNAGVQLNLTFANHRLTYGMNATPNGLNGSLAYNLNPITLALNAVVNAWPAQWTTNLVTWSGSSYSTGNLLN